MAYQIKRRRKGTQGRRSASKKRLKGGWRLLALGAVLCVAIAITYSQATGGALPTWNEIYNACLPAGQKIVPGAVPNAATKIHFIDVGQSDATLIEQDGEFCLIDAGDRDHTQELLDYLRAVGVRKLKLLVMTHEHTDHTGAMVPVLENFDVEQVLLPDFSNAEPPDGYTILRTLEYIDVAGVPDVTARVGDTYPIGMGTLTVLGSGIPTKEKNNTSVITRFTAGDFSFLSCGDAQEEATSLLRENGTKVRADVYKASHHGASDSNSEAWLQAVRPQLVAVSCGANNSYGHPHKSALDAFAGVGAKVYRTDESGNLVAAVDSEGRLHVAAQNDAAAVEVSGAVDSGTDNADASAGQGTEALPAAA